LQFLRDGDIQEMSAQVSTFPFPFRGNDLVALIIHPANEAQTVVAENFDSREHQQTVVNIVDHLDALLAFWDHDQVCAFANEAYCSWFGKTRTEIVGITVKELLGSRYEQDLQHITAAYEGKRQVFERVMSTSGGVRHSLVTYIPYVFGAHICGIFVHIADVTPLKIIEQQLQMERWRLSSILKGTNVGTWEWNVQTGEIVVNQRWAEIVGYGLEELQPFSIQKWRRLSHFADREGSREQLKQHFRAKSDICEIEGRMKHKAGHWVWVACPGKVFSWTSEGKPLMMLGSLRDVTQRKQREQAILQLSHQLEKQAVTDSLTGLLNRRGWENSIARENARVRRYGSEGCVIILDLDGLKSINDSLGHETGDELIQRAARCLRAAIRDVDSIARTGGDEFAVLTTECTEENALTILKRLEEQFEAQNVRASWGAAGFDRSTAIDTAQKKADTRMYEMKMRRRNSA
jgi:diguanylate cyclase (GGDEF)-like protein/PAS domain S-box-containing protein